MMQQTTALRKIARLKKRIRVIQGGQGAGKTIAILMLLINHAMRNPDKEIFVASAELSKMRITVIKDFLKIMKAFNVFDKTRFVDGTLYRFTNGSFIKFIGLDKEDIGKGLRSDIIFVNEANKTNFDTYRELTSRAKMIFLDYNPNKKFWVHTEVLTRDDADYVQLTFLDNEFLGKEERAEIMRYKEQGYKREADGRYAVDANGDLIIINQYWSNQWRIYGLGVTGQVEGRIYNWNSIGLDKYHAIDKQELTSVDWGKVDPWAIVDMKYADGNLYLHERNYASENEIERNLTSQELHSIRASDNDEHEGLMGWMFNRLKIPYDRYIVCDNNRPTKILSLRNSGWEYAVGVGGKNKLKERVGMLSSMNIYYTDNSKNIEAEQEAYCWDKDNDGKIIEEPIDQDNHTIDCAAYGALFMFQHGWINTL